ncbi:MAG: restriction endonuclease subunit S [Gorillibacterium sp.]|nr:restriction endonuclease subunit S [Gorillibacterium sp.]
MSRDQSYLQILDAAARMQESISRILAAKLAEAQINQVWISNQLLPGKYSETSELHKQSMELNDQLIEVIDGITKMEFGLARNLKIILNREEPQPFHGDMFGGIDS